MCTTIRRYANSTFEDTCDAMRKIAPTNRLRPDLQRVMLALPTQDASTPSGKHRTRRGSSGRWHARRFNRHGYATNKHVARHYRPK